jgi:flagellar biosynthetic protein FliR
MPDSLQPILPHIPAFLMVFFRLGGLFIFAPVLSSEVIPVRVKVLLALALSFCIYPLIGPQPAPAMNLATIAPMIAAELAIGAVIGYGVSLPLTAMQMGGSLMGLQLGLNLAQVYDPNTSDQTEVLSQLLYMMALVIFLILGGMQALVAALVASFHAVPLGAYHVNGEMLGILVGLLTAMLELGIRVAAPLLGLVFLETVAMGFLARTVPQMNILSLGFPLRIIIGFGLLVAAMATIGDVFSASMHQAVVSMLHAFGG